MVCLLSCCFPWGLGLGLNLFAPVPKQFLFVALECSVCVFLVLLFPQCFAGDNRSASESCFLFNKLQRAEKGGHMAALLCCGLKSSTCFCSLFSHRSTSWLHQSIRCQGSFFAIFYFHRPVFLLNFCIEGKKPKIAGNVVTCLSRWGCGGHIGRVGPHRCPGAVSRWRSGGRSVGSYLVFGDSKRLLRCLMAPFS